MKSEKKYAADRLNMVMSKVMIQSASKQAIVSHCLCYLVYTE